jgi:AraC-like DNA-binding protein
MSIGNRRAGTYQALNRIDINSGQIPISFLIHQFRAAELLLRNNGNIMEIANSVGISNASGFTKAFRDYFGVSLKKYSKQ